ncbi:MAG TPA: CRISPR-associated endonuclease Cas1 [Anaerolineae bacterium]|nr:CRISPR-associated endonuclease Cas1 [Anaerolineae bacterium]HUX77618.1 CRISPR-associated endonuclease Cas1 [Anaerolineae bacterium]
MAIVEHLIADTFGTHIGKYQGRLKITKRREVLAQAPLLHLHSVTIASTGVSISADALRACCEHGIPVHFVSGRGQVYASLYSAGLTGTILTRRAQLEAYRDWRGKHVAIAFAMGKIRNQAATLKYLAKTRTGSAPQAAEELRLCAGEVADYEEKLRRIEGPTCDDARPTVLTAEAHAAKKYWAAVRAIIPAKYGWQARKGRGATDPVNSLLNYGYGILYAQVERAIVLAGLDPYAGFIHADRPGKPSLVLDLIEEFRQAAVDRVVFGLLNRQFAVEQDESARLSQETRRTLATHILEHLEAGVRYEGKRQPLRVALQSQARHLATFLRGDREGYDAFQAGW